MYYFETKEFNETDTRIFKSNEKVTKGDIVVIYCNYSQHPITAEVVKIVDELTALTTRYEIDEVISVINMKNYNEKLENKKAELLLEQAMRSKIEEVKMLDTFKKFADKDPEMQSMLEHYTKLHSTPKSDSEILSED